MSDATFKFTGESEQTVLASIRNADGSTVQANPGDEVTVHPEDAIKAAAHPLLEAVSEAAHDAVALLAKLKAEAVTELQHLEAEGKAELGKVKEAAEQVKDDVVAEIDKVRGRKPATPPAPTSPTA